MESPQLVRRVPWICRNCLLRDRSHCQGEARSFVSYAVKARPRSLKSKKRRTATLAAAGGTLVAGALAFSEDVKHGYAAMERSSRVLSTLAICVNDYRKTLNNKTEDVDEMDSLLKACHKRCAERTLSLLEKNGSIFIKLGQHLSSMNYLLPLEWTTTFIPLQDNCPISSYESIEDMFIKDTGHPISSLFDNFERKPMGAASLAQVHRAKLKGTGQDVAVKVQHPALEEWVPLDMALTKFTFSTLKRFFPDYDLEWLSDEMQYSLPQELDFSLEGQNAMRAKAYFKDIHDAPLLIPDVKWGLRRILVMDYISGRRPDDLDYLDSNGIDRDEVSVALSRIFNEMIFGDGAPLHCDPHGGNIAIRKNLTRRKQNFDVILYDHGLYRDIPKQLRRDYAKLWLAVINADEKRMRKYAYAVAGITDDQFPLFASAITGRDYKVLTKSVVSSRSGREKEEITGAMGDGMLQELVKLLGQVPRIILLILKTNDLTRSLDENLHTRHGPVRTFLILARYCSRTVFQEQMETISLRGSMLWPTNLIGILRAWGSYMKIELRLSLYEYYISTRMLAGFSPVV